MSKIEELDARIAFLEKMAERVPAREYYHIQRDIAIRKREREQLIIMQQVVDVIALEPVKKQEFDKSKLYFFV